MTEPTPNLTDVLHEAITNALKDMDGGAVVTRWVLSVERYTGDGRSIAHVAAPDMHSWEVIGMAEMASEYARVQATAGLLDEMYADTEFDDDED